MRVKEGRRRLGCTGREGIHGSLELLFITPDEHSKGYGQAAWAQLEAEYPQVEVWETLTPYFETRNVLFYINKLGFEIVEFFNKDNPNPSDAKDKADSAPKGYGQGTSESQEDYEDFLFMKERSPLIWAENGSNPHSSRQQRVSYSDKQQLHHFINQQGMRGLRYESAGWLLLV